jgi:hypothetical protein
MLTADAQRCFAALRQPARAIRIARGLWIAWAVIVWNVTFDHVIVVAGREFIGKASAAASRPGSYLRMDDWMRPAVTNGFWIATAASVAILLLGFVLIGLAAVRLELRGPQSV